MSYYKACGINNHSMHESTKLVGFGWVFSGKLW